MKKTILLLPLLALATFLSAQSIDKADIQAATDAAVNLYQLDENQVEGMYKIQERRLRNLVEIESVKNSNEALYLQKKNAIRLGMEASIQRLLRDDQQSALRAQQLERRKAESALIQKMKQEGADKEAIQLAIWALD